MGKDAIAESGKTASLETLTMFACDLPDKDPAWVDWFERGQKLRVQIWGKGKKLGSHKDILELGEAMSLQPGFALSIVTYQKNELSLPKDVGYGVSYIALEPKDLNLANEKSVSPERFDEFTQILEKNHHVDWSEGIIFMDGLGVIEKMRRQGVGEFLAYARLGELFSFARDVGIKHLLFYTWGDVEQTLPLAVYKQLGFKKMNFQDEDRIFWICEVVDRD